MLENSDEGEIIFIGNPIRWKGIGVRRSPKDKKQVLEVRTKLSMVFQQFNLWSHLSILQNVVEAPVTVLRWNKKDVEESALDLLGKVGILEKKDAYPNQLSGGQQQRAAIARALCMKPEALLLDEPTSALDPELEKEVISVIKDLAREGTTMLIVTHDMQLARDIADQVIFLHMGKIEESGNPDRIFSRPTSERLKRFLAS